MGIELNELNLSDQYSLYKVIDGGMFDGFTTRRLEVEASSENPANGNMWERLRDERLEILENIEEAIKKTVNSIDLHS